jgi:hypothetical protein
MAALGGYGTGQYGSQYGPNNDLNPGLPQNAPGFLRKRW